MLDVVQAIDGPRPIFECREIRGRCAVFDGSAPDWATSGTCSIHALMLTAQKRMEEALAQQTLLDLVRKTARKAPPSFDEQVVRWMGARRDGVTTSTD
ncbi:hypothetical protein D3C85_1662560 [compost metagenome]